MNFRFTQQQIARCLPRNPNPALWYQAMVEVLPAYNINTLERVAGFISQCAYESADFTRLEENLNYSAAGLEKIFSKYFSRAGVSAVGYARNPQRIANRVYANRMGNGDEASGDGWRYRGRGIIQLTGFNNYSAFARSIDVKVDEAIRYVTTPQGAIESACWFWQTRNINPAADVRDVERMTRLVNGGTHGLEGRRELFNNAMRILGTTAQTNTSESQRPSHSRPLAPATSQHRTLSIGSRGDDVRRLQEYLGIPADGVFGRQTAESLRRWQTFNKISATGVADPATLKRIFG